MVNLREAAAGTKSARGGVLKQKIAVVGDRLQQFADELVARLWVVFFFGHQLNSGWLDAN
jgi:hypothetical protein